MKRLLLLGIALFLLIALVGCRQHNVVEDEFDVADSYEEESHTLYEQEEEVYAYEQEGDAGIEACWPVDEITFSSVEDFLSAYMIARAGGGIEHLASEWQGLFGRGAHVTFAESVEAVNFTSLENVHLPIGIPDEFELFTIMVNEGIVSFIFMHPDDMVSEDIAWNALQNYRMLRFTFARWDMDDDVLFDIMMQQSTECEVLIDGKYLFRESMFGGYTFRWVSDRTRFWLQLPAQRHIFGEDIRSAENETFSMATELGGVSLDDPYAMVSFTETVTLNLQDTRAVEAMIEELAER